MSIAKMLLVAALYVVAASSCATSDANENTQKDVVMKSVTIPVDGMACDSCAARIRKNLAGIDGVATATVSFDERRAVIQYDARKLEPKRLAAAINGLGFKAGAPVDEAAR